MAQLTQFTSSSCPPLFGVVFKGRPHCTEVNDSVLAYVASHHPDRVILAADWSDLDWQLVEDTVTRLRKLQVQHIELVGPFPSWPSGLPVVLFKYARKQPLSTPLPHRLAFGLSSNFMQVDKSMEESAKRWNVQYFSPYRVLCNANGCLTMLGDSPATLTAWDGSHLTDASSIYVVSHFEDSFLH
jgi:hypothetical protein